MTGLITIVAGLVGVPRPLPGIIAWATIAVPVSGAVWGGYEIIKHWGAQEVRDQIEKENADAIRKGIEASRLLTTALLLAGCGTSGVNSVPALRAAIGSRLAGAKGKTVEDQYKIDGTMAPGCAVKLYTAAECDRHTKASVERRAELK
ncbi:hypothetical protein LB566_27110 [Mesorhizobium sp. CA13]|uniref:hypothetical protein n=1 Tax=Mesorhizobium sp. CA13 TaxID=2876643 RepID=UPI001CCF978F|nr:hypothetical protein [Mesorhizobium sp. CA13]MBZ9857460.1 hypothetical protein [Mesorhizobium sp. CA13]